VELSIGQVVAAGIGIFIAIPATLAAYSTRKQSEAKIWEGLYHAKEAEGVDRDKRMAILEAKVALLESHFIKEVAKGVVEAVVSSLDERERERFRG
jgi:hypothetical protein